MKRRNRMRYDKNRRQWVTFIKLRYDRDNNRYLQTLLCEPVRPQELKEREKEGWKVV